MATPLVLGLLPLATLAVLACVIGNLAPSWSWRKVCLRASVLWGTYLVLVTELLSPVHWVTRVGLSASWLVPLVVLAWTLFRLSRRGRPLRGSGLELPRSWIGRVSVAVIGVIVLVTAVIAWVAPPNTFDSLTYHMSRVAHWAQDQSLEPFATGIMRQAYMSPGAEVFVLHSYVLMAGDRMANFIEWLAMLACLVGAVKIAHDLGANHRGQWLAALFVATLPMGIAQASSTMTDYVVAWWVVCIAAEASDWAVADPRSDNFVFMGLAAGLALLTKPTAVAYLAPLAFLAIIMLLRTFPVRHAMVLVAFACLSVLALNAGHWVRNTTSFGSPLGSATQVGTFTNEVLSWQVVASNVLRNASLHAGTSWRWLNDQLYLGLAKVHWKLGLAMDDPRTSWHKIFAVFPPQLDENRVANPAQALFGLIAAGMLVVGKRLRTTAAMTYTTAVVFSFILFGGLFKFDILGSRYHMPFFVLLAPIAGVAYGNLRAWSSWVVAVVLAVGAYSPLLLLNERPLLNTAHQPSILYLDREELYLRADRGLYKAFSSMTSRVKASGCGDLGLMLHGNTPEYPIWVLMDAPRKDLTVDWIISRGDATGKFRRPDFSPCAVICQGCGEGTTTVSGLPLKEEAGDFRLYLREATYE